MFRRCLLEIRILEPKEADCIVLDEIRGENQLGLVKRIKSHYPYNENNDVMEFRKKKGQTLVHISRNNIIADHQGCILVSPYLILDGLMKSASKALLVFENFAVYMIKENKLVSDHGFFYFDCKDKLLYFSKKYCFDSIFEFIQIGSKYYVHEIKEDIVGPEKRMRFMYRFGIYNLSGKKIADYKRLLFMYLCILLVMFSFRTFLCHKNIMLKENLESITQNNIRENSTIQLFDHSRDNLVLLFDILNECPEIDSINKISIDGKKFSIVVTSKSRIDLMKKFRNGRFSSVSLDGISINKDGFKEMHINGGFNE